MTISNLLYSGITLCMFIHSTLAYRATPNNLPDLRQATHFPYIVIKNCLKKNGGSRQILEHQQNRIICFLFLSRQIRRKYNLFGGGKYHEPNSDLHLGETGPNLSILNGKKSLLKNTVNVDIRQPVCIINLFSVRIQY